MTATVRFIDEFIDQDHLTGFLEICRHMRLYSISSIAPWKRLASLCFLFALCFSLAAQNGCEDDAGNIYGPYEELMVSDDPCENFTCIPSAFSFVWVSNSEFLDDCGGDEDDDEDGFDDEDLDELIEWLEEICASNDTLEVDFDIEEACALLEMIQACLDGDEAVCEEVFVLIEELGDSWNDEEDDDEEDDEDDEEDDEEEESEDECEVEFEFEQALDEDGVPLPYNIVAYVDEPEADTYYFWTFGDGNESDEPNPTHVYDEVGNYEVCLTVTQMVGNFLECTATYCDTLMIDVDGLVRQQLVLNILFPGQTINTVAEQQRSLEVYPNPVADVFRIRLEEGIESAVVRTLDGRWVGRWVANGLQTMEVPCSAWPTGAYVLEVRTAEGVMRSRVLVQR